MSKDAAVVITKFRSPEYSCSEYRVAYMQAYSNLYESPYYVFNALTQTGRDAIEAELNEILAHSVFKTKNISIKKLSLDLQEDKVEGEDNAQAKK